MSSNLSLYEKHASSFSTVLVASIYATVVLATTAADVISIVLCAFTYLNLLIGGFLLVTHDGVISNVVKGSVCLMFLLSLVGVILILFVSAVDHVLLMLSFWYIILMAGSFIAKHMLNVKRTVANNLLGQFVTQLAYVILWCIGVAASTQPFTIAALVLSLITLFIVVLDLVNGKNMKDGTLKAMHIFSNLIWSVFAGFFTPANPIALIQLALSAFYLRGHIKR